MNGLRSILLVDDNPNDRALVQRHVRRQFADLTLVHVTEMAELETALADAEPALVITDYALRWSTGLVVLSAVKQRFPRCPVIMFTGTGSEEVAVEAMKAGLDDYVLKSPKLHRLASAVKLLVERRQQQAAVEEVETRYRELFDGVPVGLFRAAPDGRILAANPALVRMLGYPDTETLCRVPMRDLPIRPDALSEVGALVDAAGVVRGFETEFRRPDGAVVWLHASHRIVRDDDGGLVAIEGSVEDITEQKRNLQRGSIGSG